MKSKPYKFLCLGHFDKDWAPCQVCSLKEKCLREKMKSDALLSSVPPKNEKG